MVKSLLSRLSGKSKNAAVDVPSVDLSRVLGPKAAPEAAPAPPVDVLDVDVETIDVEVWMHADLDQLASTWDALQETPDSADARQAFSQAVHNLHGASGAYGGGALTRLTGSLQKLLTKCKDIGPEAALINLHVQACRAAAIDSLASEDVAGAVVATLERQVDKRQKD